jgi:putative ABC transport system permease protein
MQPRFMWRGADVYLPIVFQRGKFVEGVHYVNVIGRAKPGITAAEADTDLHPVIQDILSRDPSYHHESFQMKLYNFYETYPSSIRKQLWILFTAVSILLLIACTNVSNLMLARATARSREMALRASLGAGRLRIVRQLLTESLLVGLASAVLGTVLAFAGLYAVVAIIPPNTLPDESKVSLNVPVLAFTLALSLLTALLFGLAPAFQAARTELAGTLRSSGRGLAGSLLPRADCARFWWPLKCRWQCYCWLAQAWCLEHYSNCRISILAINPILCLACRFHCLRAATQQSR